MIPLRILHAVPSMDGEELQAAQPSLIALARHGHETALLIPDTERTITDDGRTILSYTPGWWGWVRRERRITVRKVATWTPDLLHAHGLANLGTTLDLARRLGLSVVVTLHHAEEPYAARRLRDPLVTWVLVPTEHHRAHALARIGLARDRVAIAPLGVTVEAAPTASSLASAWTIGAIDPGERAALRRWLTAVAEVQQAGLPLTARLLTTDPDRATEMAIATGCTLVCATGHDIAHFTAGCDVLALPGNRECSPLLPLTAMALGKPVIGIATGGLPELVRDGQTAVLVKAGDRDAMADAIRLLHDRGRRQQMGDAGRSLARERYSAELVGEALVAVYRSALGDAGVGGKAEITSAWRRMTESRSR